MNRFTLVLVVVLALISLFHPQVRALAHETKVQHGEHDKKGEHISAGQESLKGNPPSPSSSVGPDIRPRLMRLAAGIRQRPQRRTESPSAASKPTRLAAASIERESVPGAAMDNPGTSDFRALIRQLRAGEDYVRYQAAEELGRSADTRALLDLVDSFAKDKHPLVRAKSGRAIMKIKKLSNYGDLEIIVAGFQRLSGDNVVPKKLVDLLIAEPLISLANHKTNANPKTRAAFIQFLGMTMDTRVTGTLIFNMNDPDEFVRFTVIEAARRINDPLSHGPLRSRLRGGINYENDPDVRAYLRAVVGSFEKK